MNEICAPKLKEQAKLYYKKIGSPDPTLNDPERLVPLCDILGCMEEATQAHGTFQSPIYTCGPHAQEVMYWLAMQILGDARRTLM